MTGMKLNRGAVIREPGSTEKTKTGAWRAFKPILDQEKCKKCGICWANCPDAAIKKTDKGEFKVDYDYCKGCGICAQVCPFKVIKMELEEK